MATDETINRVSATLKGCFPVWGRELTVEAREAWVVFLRGFPDKAVLKAATRLIERHKGPHLTIADFREHLREAQMDAQWDAPQLPPGSSERRLTLEEYLELHPEDAGKAEIFRQPLDDVPGEV